MDGSMCRFMIEDPTGGRSMSSNPIENDTPKPSPSVNLTFLSIGSQICQ